MEPKALEVAHEESLKFYWLASIVILLFEYLIKLDDEIKCFWRGRPSFAQYLFIFNRYFPLLAYSTALTFLFNRDASTELCEGFVFILPVVMYITGAVLSTIVLLRTRALFPRSFHVFLTLLILFTGQMIFGGFVTYAATRGPGFKGFLGCVAQYPPQYSYFLAFYWTAGTLFDVAVFTLTLYATLRLQDSKEKVPLVSLIHRDGVTYFVVMLLAKIVDLTVFLMSPSDLVNVNWVFNNVICIVMVNRIFMNIRSHAQHNATFAKHLSSFDLTLPDVS